MKRADEEDIRTIAKELDYFADNWEISKLSSFSVIELLILIEKKYGVFFEHGEWEEIVELKELVDLINYKLQQIENTV